MLNEEASSLSFDPAFGLKGNAVAFPFDPGLDLLRTMGVAFQELGRGGIDYAEKALRDSLTASA